MPWKCVRSGATLTATPWNETQRRTRMPSAAILSSAAAPSSPAGLSGRRDPDADAVLAGLADDAELGERVDQPALQRADEGAHVGATAPEVEHDIGDALPGPVIGELAAAPGAMHGKARVERSPSLALVPAV